MIRFCGGEQGVERLRGERVGEMEWIVRHEKVGRLFWERAPFGDDESKQLA